MIAEDFERRLDAIDGHRPVAHFGHDIDHQRQGGDMVEMRVRDENVIDEHHFGQVEIGQPRTGIDQNVTIDAQRGRPQRIAAIAANTAVTT